MGTTKCNVCKTRTVGSGGKAYDTQAAAANGLCGPCDTEGGWENEHSDRGHNAESTEVATLMEDDTVGKRVEGCWVCYPEINMAQREHKPRTSKGGQGKATTRRPQLNHRTQCLHPQTPEARRECRKAFWALEAKAEEVAADPATTAKARGTATAVKALNEHMLKATTAAKVAAKVRAQAKAKKK